MPDRSSPSDDQTPVALVTGGSAGLGMVIAEVFASAGYRVLIVARSPEKLSAAKQRLDASASRPVETEACDLVDAAAVKELAETVAVKFGRLDVLVNNVGESDRGLIADISADRMRELFDRNVVTTLNCSQAMKPLLQQSRGSIVNIGSLAGKVGARYLGGYNAAKHALAGLTQQMRLEWIDSGIHIALVSPGPIRRDDAGRRYQVDESLPDTAAKPGGGARVKGLDPRRVAESVLRCVQRKRTDVILPGYLRCLITIGNAWPKLGDWLLLKFTS